jgi:hypothetical protein
LPVSEGLDPLDRVQQTNVIDPPFQTPAARSSEKTKLSQQSFLMQVVNVRL